MTINTRSDVLYEIGEGEKKCSLPKNCIDAIASALNIILNSSLQANTVLLYGSRARGNAKFESDIDLLVLLDSPFKASDVAKARSLLSVVFPEVDAHFMLSKEYDSYSNTYMNNVKKDGVIIWNR